MTHEPHKIFPSGSLRNIFKDAVSHFFLLYDRCQISKDLRFNFYHLIRFRQVDSMGVKLRIKLFSQVVGHQCDKRVAHANAVFFEGLFVFDAIDVLAEILADLIRFEQNFGDHQLDDHEATDQEALTLIVRVGLGFLRPFECHDFVFERQQEVVWDLRPVVG